MKNREMLEFTKELMELFESSSLSSFEYSEKDYSLKLNKGGVEYVAPTVASKSVTTTEEVDSPVVENLNVVKSPIVGTFYDSSSPEAAPYVKVGDSVKKGQILCIVEAMKVMNEISSTCDGQVVEILVNDGEGVEFDQPLFKIK